MLMCAKYAASPNFFGYCGPAKSSNIIDHLRSDIADQELKYIISEFETLYPYLQLIARINGIDDPFDSRVVEAYWIGNSLLNKIKKNEYLNFLQERLFLDKKLPRASFQKIKHKIALIPFLPHHSFHVFNIFRRTGHDPDFQTIETMDECRINYGKIQKSKSDKLKFKSLNKFIVKARRLMITKNKLYLSEPSIREINGDYKGKKFIRELKEGEWVSFHWGHICDVLTERQVNNLEFYTQKAINYYNS